MNNYILPFIFQKESPQILTYLSSIKKQKIQTILFSIGFYHNVINKINKSFKNTIYFPSADLKILEREKTFKI